jgi:hypothetical protein
VGVEQHFMRLQQVGPYHEGAAVAELEVGDLQLGPLAANDGMLLAPVELECLARAKGQRHEDTAAGSLLLALAVISLSLHDGGDPPVRPIVAEPGQLRVELPGAVRFCLRGLRASVRGQTASRSAKGSSLLGRSGVLNTGSTASDRRYLRMVFRDRPVRRAIAWIDRCSRKCQCRITLNNAMSNTPAVLPKGPRLASEHESTLSGNFTPNRGRSQWQSTPKLARDLVNVSSANIERAIGYVERTMEQRIRQVALEGGARQGIRMLGTAPSGEPMQRNRLLL